MKSVLFFVAVVVGLGVVGAAWAAMDSEGYILWDRVGVAPLIPGGVSDSETVTIPAHKPDVLAALKLRYPQHDPNALYAGLVEAGVTETSFVPGTRFKSMIYKSRTGAVTQTPPVKWVGAPSLDAYVYTTQAGPVVFLKACGNIPGEVQGVGPVPPPRAPRAQGPSSPPADQYRSITTVPAPAAPSVVVNNYITVSGGYATSSASQAAPYQSGRQYFPSAAPAAPMYAPPYRPPYQHQPAQMYPSQGYQNPLGYLAAGALGYFVGRDHRRDNRLVVVQPPAQNRVRIINNNINRSQVRIRVRR